MKDPTKTKFFQLCLVLMITIVVSETFHFCTKEAYARESAPTADYDSSTYQITIQPALSVTDRCAEATVTKVAPVDSSDFSRYLPTVTHKQIKKGARKAQKAITEEKERLAKEEAKKEAEKKQLVGQFKLTAYCSCVACTGNGSGMTATGTYATVGRTIAADPSILPYGTTIYIEGYGTYTVEDTGYLGPYTLDVYCGSHQEALNFGVRYANVYIVNE